MSFPFLLLIFTFIIAFFLLLVCTLSGDVENLAMAVSSHRTLYVSSTTLVWVRLNFTTSEVDERHLLWVVYQSCWGVVGGLLVHEEVLCIRGIFRVIVVALGEVILQLLHHIYVSSSVVPAKYCDFKVFPFCSFGRCLLTWVWLVRYSRYQTLLIRKVLGYS